LASAAVDLADSDTGGIVAATVMGALGFVFVLSLKSKPVSAVPSPNLPDRLV
jgi:hypothetical protein